METRRKKVDEEFVESSDDDGSGDWNPSEKLWDESIVQESQSNTTETVHRKRMEVEETFNAKARMEAAAQEKVVGNYAQTLEKKNQFSDFIGFEETNNNPQLEILPDEYGGEFKLGEWENGKNCGVGQKALLDVGVDYCAKNKTKVKRPNFSRQQKPTVTGFF
ncbi:unnamed protein product [Vicia faba]|uniref:Uncharacterized protein n=1 Tax=Vicia faba TaxID=3906 RepID=A0AAV1AWW4_VICFA|nr:unnamed protein product [Vicia faba]